MIAMAEPEPITCPRLYRIAHNDLGTSMPPLFPPSGDGSAS